MNRIYKVIWNEALNCFTAVGEYAKTRGKSSKSSVSANASINTTSNLSSTRFFRLSTIGIGLIAAGLTMSPQVFSATGVNGAVATGVTSCGTSAIAGKTDSVAVGCDSVADLSSDPNIYFYDRENPYNQSVDISTDFNSTAIGTGAKAREAGTSLGMHASSRNLGVALGIQAKSDNVAALAIGPAALAKGNTSLALGRQSAAIADFAQAIGNVASATGTGSLAVGHSARAEGYRSIAIGSADIANAGKKGDQEGVTYQINQQTLAEGEDSIALGSGAESLKEDSVALGSYSTANVAGGITGYDPTGNNNAAITATKSTTGAVSVGRSASNEKAAVRRQIVNVAAGTNNSDAVNVSQLKGLAGLELDFDGDTGNTVSRKLGEKLTVKGGAATALSSGNIGVVADDSDNTLTVKLAKDLTNMNNITFLGGSTVSLSGNGLNNGGNQITGVASGGSLTDPNDQNNAANIGDLNDAVSNNKTKYYSVKSMGGSNDDNQGATGVNAMAMGRNSSATGSQGIAIGSVGGGSAQRTLASGEQSIAIGANVVSSGNSSIAIGGDDLDAASADAGAIFTAYTGSSLVETPPYMVNTESDGAASIAIGAKALSKGDLSTAVGVRSSSSGQASSAFGMGSSASKDGSVALGAGSTTLNDATYQEKLTIGNKDYFYAGATNDKGAQVSVGSEERERQIKHVASGEVSKTSTDGINGSQLHATNESVKDLSDVVVSNKTHFYSVNSTDSTRGNYNNNGATGVDAMAAGIDASAEGENATALGTNSNAEGTRSTAIGYKAQAKDRNAIALGYKANASNKHSTAIGYAANAGYAAIAIGDAATATKKGSTAIGSKSVSTGEYSTALGRAAKALKKNTVALGYNTTASGDSSVAIGDGSKANGVNSIAIGTGNIVNGDNSGAFGDPNIINGTGSYAVGNNNIIDADNAFVVGNNVTVAAGLDGAVGIGNNSTVTASTVTSFVPTGATSVVGTATGSNVVSVGSADNERRLTNVAAGGADTDAVNVSQLKQLNNTVVANKTHFYSVNNTDPTAGNYNNNGATGNNAMAAGVNANAVGLDATAVGSASNAEGKWSTAVGFNGKAKGRSSVALGHQANANHNNAAAVGYGASAGYASTAIGERSKAEKKGSTAIGSQSEAIGVYSTALGREAKAVGNNSIALGHGATASGNGNAFAGRDTAAIALGLNSTASAKDSMALGQDAEATGDDSIAMGHGAIASGKQSISVGTGNVVSGDNSGAFGDPNIISGTGSYAVGNNNNIANNNTFVLGNNVGTTQDNSVVLGHLSTDRAATTETGITINGTNYSYAGKGSATNGVMSVGFVDGERQIINVAAGEVSATSTDAINGSQLHATNEAISDLSGTVIANKTKYYSVKSGATGNKNNDGAQGPNSMAMGGNASATGGQAIAIGSGESGQNTVASGQQSIAIGANVVSSGNSSIAIGGDDLDAASADAGAMFTAYTGSSLVESPPYMVNTESDGAASIAIGAKALSEGALSTAVGVRSSSAGDASSAFGMGSSAVAEGSVALGAGSVANVAGGAMGYDPTGSSDAAIKSTQSGARYGAVSVGNGAEGGNRQIVNVAAGTNDSDAVNVAQLKGLSGVVNQGLKFDGDTGTPVTRQMGDTLTVKGGATNLSDNNIGVVANDTNKTLTVKLAKDLTGLDSVTTGNTVMSNNDGVTFLGGSSVQLSDAGLHNGGNQITGVASGGSLTDLNDQNNAANIGDLNNAIGDVTTLGFGIKAADNNTVQKNLGQTVDIIGSNGNITTQVDSGKVEVVLNNNLDLGNNGTVTTGNVLSGTNVNRLGMVTGGLLTGGVTTVSGAGVTVTGLNPFNPSSAALTSNGLTILNGPSITKSGGVNAGNKKVVNVDDGLIGLNSKDAINGGQLYETNNEIAKGIKFNVNDASSGGTLKRTFALGEEIKLDTDSNLTTTALPLGDGIKLGLADMIQVGTTNPVSINGYTGTISGLTNRTFDPTTTYTGGIAATQEQLSGLSGTITDLGFDITADNASLAPNETKDKVKLGDTVKYTSADGSIVTTVADNEIDFALGDNLNVGGAGQDGEDGVDGFIGVNGADGASGVAINGADGTIGLTGPAGIDGVSPTLTMRPEIQSGDVFDDDTDVTRLSYEDGDGNSHTIATLEDDGLRFSGNDNPTVGYVTRNLNKEMQIVGSKTAVGTYSSGNINTIATQGGGIEIQMADSPKFGEVTINAENTGKITGLTAGEDDTDAVNVYQLNQTNATINQGLDFGGDSGTDVNRKLGQKLIVKGDDTINADPATKNISVTADGDDTLNIRLDKDINLGNTGSVTTGNTQVNNAGVTLYNGDNDQVALTNNGLNNGKNKITNVADGLLSATSKDAVNGSQLFKTNNEIAKGIKIGDGNSANDQQFALGDTINVTGDSNLTTVASATGVQVKLNNQLDLGDDGSIQIGNSIMSDAGFTFVGNGVNRMVSQVSLSSRGLDNGGNTIRNVGEGVLNTDAVNVGQLKDVAIALDQGWGITAQGDIATMVKQGDAVDLSSKDGNIKVTRTLVNGGLARQAGRAAGANDISFDLNRDIAVDSLQTGDSTLTSDGLTIAGGPSVTKSGINAADTKITNVVNGDVSESSQDAINGGQLYAQGSGISSIIGGDTVYNPVDGSFTNNNIGGTGENSIDGAIASIKRGEIIINENIQTNTTNIESNTTKIDANAADIMTNTTNIETNTTNIKVNKDKIDAGLNFGADSGANINKPVGDDSVLSFKGGNNITTTAQGSSITFDLNGNINMDSVTTGNTVINNSGVTIQDGPSMTAAGIYTGDSETAPSMTTDGINAAGTKVTNVADGMAPRDAVNFGQLDAVTRGLGNSINELGYRVDDVEDEANAGISAAMAMSSMPQSFLPGKSLVGGGVATYNGESAVAIGLSKVSDDGRWIMKISGTADTQGNAGGAIGAGFHF
ncbi:YadA-like family protein [uncultured Psychrobacter sp.]|uniref:ESPR-type extended signal peptide-containing protein n=1 Tax=uncultured Psychrobacter sp. TaxID=259303 RepID=UPI0026258BBE|nr:YadA-like family protein [uncultured Psychrobacter sp.]